MASPPTKPTDPSASASTGQASFGYRDVPAADKAGLVRRVFESVAPRYDLMNDLMSGGVHRLWKNALVDVANPRPGERFLDVAGGTGDIAFRLFRRQSERGEKPDVTVCDINPAMLAVGRDRAADRGLLKGLTWTTGDAESLPFPDRSFDGYTIAFGLRNVTDIDKALARSAPRAEAGRPLPLPGIQQGEVGARSAASTTPTPNGPCRSSAASSPAMPSPTAICTRASAASRRSAPWPSACARRASPTSRGAT